MTNTVAKSLLILSLLPTTLVAATKQIHKAPYLRFAGSVHYPKVNKQNNLLAFTNKDGFGLKIVDLKTKEVANVTLQKVSHSFFWAPNGFRLFYKEMYQLGDQVVSEINERINI